MKRKSIDFTANAIVTRLAHIFSLEVNFNIALDIAPLVLKQSSQPKLAGTTTSLGEAYQGTETLLLSTDAKLGVQVVDQQDE